MLNLKEMNDRVEKLKALIEEAAKDDQQHRPIDHFISSYEKKAMVAGYDKEAAKEDDQEFVLESRLVDSIPPMKSDVDFTFEQSVGRRSSEITCGSLGRVSEIPCGSVAAPLAPYEEATDVDNASSSRPAERCENNEELAAMAAGGDAFVEDETPTMSP
jgi:hypothetical protein